MNFVQTIRRAPAPLVLTVLALLGACAVAPVPPDSAPACPAPTVCLVCQVCLEPLPPPAPPPPKVSALEPVDYDAVAGWREDDPTEAFGALRASCRALRFQAPWNEACAKALALDTPDRGQLRRFFEAEFIPHRVANSDGTTQGMITGYYEPLLRGSRSKAAPYLYPLYAPPEDLLTIDLIAINPDLRNMRLRGRIEGRRVVPYYSRAEIENGSAPVGGREILWVDDPVEAFFLQIQGSGRVLIDSGETVRIGYADQNGHPYQSIGRWLLDRGELQAGDATMHGIKAWGRANPARLAELLHRNPSYVFFRETPPGDSPIDGPPGALGVPLSAGRSIAVDPRFIPLGAPVFLATTWPNSSAPLARLMLAQDTGGAIRGAVRADFFWGYGAEAGALAGRMRQQGRMWVLLPRGYPIPKQP